MLRKITAVFCFLVLFSFEVKGEPKFEADVHVDETAVSVTIAKAQAMAKATREAISEVVQSVSTERAVKDINELNDNQLQHFVTSVMVLMEKSSNVRYIADLRISIDEDILKAYMDENEMPFIAKEEQTILIVPVLEKEDGKCDAWGEDNFWRKSFVDKGIIERGNLKIKTIEKNLGNIAAVGAGRFYDMSDGEYNELSGFNKVNQIYVLKYSKKDKRLFIKSFPQREVIELGVEDKELQELIKEAVLSLKGKTVEISEYGAAKEGRTVYDVVYTYPRLSKWTELKKMLEANPQVDDVKIITMGNGKVRFQFEFNGVIEKLQALLGVAGYQMKNEGGYYAIY